MKNLRVIVQSVESSTATWRLAHGAVNGLLSDSSPKPFDFRALMANPDDQASKTRHHFIASRKGDKHSCSGLCDFKNLVYH